MIAKEILLISHSTRPRGGLVHTLHLAEALAQLGEPVRVVALGDPAEGLFRPTPVPLTVVATRPSAPSLEERVVAAIDALAEALARLTPGAAVLHAQDCIAARAAARVRDSGGGAPPVVRTVHHVDDFTTPALVECQRLAILEPDLLLVVSEHWRRLLSDGYGVEATVVGNGVDPGRFPALDAGQRRELRARVGAEQRFLVLTVGGVEPRKGTVTLFEALAELKRRLVPAPVLAVVGGHSFQDYRPYRDAALAGLPELGLELGRDVVLLGTVPEAELGGWYAAADAFAFPSLKEGFGLAPLEALAAGLPVVASDIPVFREFLADGESALLVPPGDASALAGALRSLALDTTLRSRLVAGGPPVAARFTWSASARRHQAIYAPLRTPAVARSS
jgi:glycosyltransferase-like protein